MEPAERLDRLWAALIDRLIIVAVVSAAVVPMRLLEGAGGLFVAYMGVAGGLLVLFAVQAWLLTTRGQTIGKRIIGLRIVKVADMTNGGFTTNVLLRGLVNTAISAVHVIGAIYFLADPAFIFREDRRCIHDHIAGTRVIKA